MLYIVDTIGIHTGTKFYNLALSELFLSRGIDAKVLSNYNEKRCMKLLFNFYTGFVFSKIGKLCLSLLFYYVFMIWKYRKTRLIIYQSYGLRFIDILFTFLFYPSKKLVLLIHDVFDQKHDSRKTYKRIQHCIYKYLLKSVIIQSAKAKDEILSIEFKGQIFHMPIPKVRVSYDYNEMNLAKDVKSAVLSEKVNFLFFGAIREAKGLDVLVESTQFMKKESLGKINIVVAGMDSQNILKKLLNKFSLDYMQVINRWINDDEMKYLFLKSDAVIIPYKRIYQSGVLDMAYNFKKWVIMADHGYFIKENENYHMGSCFQNDNAADLATKMQEFIKLGRSKELEYGEGRKIYYDERIFDEFVSEIKVKIEMMSA